jgi:hypothetical protein
MYKNLFFSLAILSMILALVGTALGGYLDMFGKPVVITKQHAWNDGIFMILLAIFFLILSRV